MLAFFPMPLGVNDCIILTLDSFLEPMDEVFGGLEPQDEGATPSEVQETTLEPEVSLEPQENTVEKPEPVVEEETPVIEEVEEPEYFKGKRRQVSIFMSPFNVHVTRYAASGTITFSKYHPGKYLVAWHPKSSTENERTTVVIHTPKFGEILYRQIAGALARRIVNYAEEGEQVVQGEDAGFIKFGSRVDVFLPLDSKICVDLQQKVVGARTCIAMLPEKNG